MVVVDWGNVVAAESCFGVTLLVGGVVVVVRSPKIDGKETFNDNNKNTFYL